MALGLLMIMFVAMSVNSIGRSDSAVPAQE